jgi:hypothetical protein
MTFVATTITVSGYEPVQAIGYGTVAVMSLATTSAELARFRFRVTMPWVPGNGDDPRRLFGVSKPQYCLVCNVPIGAEQQHGLCLACLDVTGPVRCHYCRRHVSRRHMNNSRLGFRWYCDACCEQLAGACMRSYGRLPRRFEFYCVSCGVIRQKREMQRSSQGHRRYRCRRCRARQVRQAEDRRLLARRRGKLNGR